MSKYMTKKQFESEFRETVLPSIREQFESDGRGIDRIARREAWNDVVDASIKAGVLPRYAENWSAPW